MYIFTEDDIRQCVHLDSDVISVIETAFSDLALRSVVTPSIMRIDIPEYEGEVDIKSAYVPGKSFFAIKISSGFFQNHLRGLKTGNGMMTLLDVQTGIPAAILLDNGYLTDIRTAAAGAVAAKYLARQHIQTVGVIGVGLQARFQIQALQKVRNFERVLVYGRKQEKIDEYIHEMSSLLGVPVISASSVESLVRKSDVIVTTTPSRSPIIEPDWLHPGLHITAMGSDAEHKQELHPQVLAAADMVVCDLQAQCQRLGELHHAIDQGITVNQDQILELGKITSGQVAGRVTDSQITVCDLTGTGVQDTAIANYAFEWLRQRESGMRI